MEQEKAAGVVSLPNKVLPLINLTEAELVQQDFSDGWLEIGEGEVPHQAVRDNLSVMRLLFPINLGKGLMDDLFVIVLDGCQLTQFASFLIVALFCVALFPFQLQVTEGAEQPHLFAYQIFHFYYGQTITAIFKRLPIPLL